MRQADLNRAVAKATGEAISLIDQMGFQHVEVPVWRPRRQRRRRRRWYRPKPVCVPA